MTVVLAPDAVDIDPLAPTAAGVWHGRGVTVRRVAASLLPGQPARVRIDDGRLLVEHRLTPAQICDDVAVGIAAGIGGRADFEEVFTGLVRTTVDGPVRSWRRFYLNTVTRLERGTAAFAPVHARAADLIEGRDVIDLGSCFGFFPLRLAARGIGVVATDLSGPTMNLLAQVAPLLGRRVLTLTCNAATVPLPDGCAATVTALHLLEHLQPAAAEAVLDEAVRLARRRVVVAVPFEDEPAACYGHVQRFDADDLHRLGARVCDRHPGLRMSVTEYHGGWLVLDRPDPPARGRRSTGSSTRGRPARTALSMTPQP